jgi:cell wall-associated NlpC family hydrolase
MRTRDYPSAAALAPPARPLQCAPQARAFAAAALAALLALLAAGCGSAPTRPESRTSTVPARLHPPPADPFASNDVLMRAIGLVGTPYRYGGNTPAGGFDCSGLVGYVFQDAAARALPRSTAGLVAMRAPAVGALELEPGDLVFFNPGGGSASHIGIFVGEGRFVHAPSTGGTVRLDRLDADYWRQSFVAARRVLTATN